MGTVRITSNQSSPTVAFYLEADLYSTEPSYGSYGRWRIRYYLRAVNTGTSSSQYSGSGTQIGRGNGVEFGRHTGNPFLPNVAAGATRWHDGPWYAYVNANSNGYWSGTSTAFPLQMALAYGNVNVTPTGVVTLPRISRLAGAPGTPTTSNITPTGLTLSWTAAVRGTAAIDYYEYQFSLSSSFTSPTTVNAGNVLTAVVGALNPGTTYYFRVRAHSADGFGPYSGTKLQTTLPSTPATIAVSPSPTGAAATVTVGPPAGMTAVDYYTVQWEYRSPAPLPPVVTHSQDLAVGVTTATITGLTPGATYRWVVIGHIGGYSMPPSTGLDKAQPKPNTAPGDFFDGNTPDTADADFTWSGTANLSTTIVKGKVPTGWRGITASAGGTYAVHRVVGGRSGTYAARLVMLTDATGPGICIGMGGLSGTASYAAVEGGEAYVGSLYVMPSRAQCLMAQFRWFNAAGTEITSASGPAVVAQPDVWTRLIVEQNAPADAAFCAVWARDTNADPAWSPWLTGEWLLGDDVMVTLGATYPYFDGSFPDTALYDYAWTGTANASTSTRTDVPQPEYDPLDDPNCEDVPSPPRPPAVPNQCIDTITSWRRYWAIIPPEMVSSWASIIPTLVITSGDEPTRQIRLRYYENPDNLFPDVFEPTQWVSEQIVSYLPPYSELTIDGVTERSWASVGGGPELSADHLLFGTGGTPASWPVLSCGIGYLASADVPVGGDVGNLHVDVKLTQRS